MAKYGIAISTYFGKDTSPKRINIFLASIYSLLSSEFDGKIIIVDDCSQTNEHLKFIPTEKIQVIKRNTNNGLGRCKNTCIKNLLDCEYLFIADDDNIYNGRWWELYINACIDTGIPHFSLYTKQPYHLPITTTTIKNTVIKNHRELNGNFLFMTNKLIAEIGGFKIMPYKYGFEHTNFTERCLKCRKIPFFCDVAGSEERIYLNKSSLNNKSMIPDVEKANKLNSPLNINPHIYEPIED